MAVETRPRAQVYSLKTPLLAEGRTTTQIAESDLMTVMIKVYAEGGENGLHAHTREDHTFVVLQGQATFYDENETPTVVNKYEGIMLPKGAFYWFKSTGDTNLVLLRVGASTDEAAHERMKPNGEPIPAHSEDNKHVKGVPLPGKFFGE